MKDVHTEHCCDKHGCKYNQDAICTVTTGKAPQSHRCESCESEGRDVRPWGSYTVLVDAPDHKVKTITIKAGRRISLQRHQKRAEMWICVTGKLEVFRCSVLQIVPSQKNAQCTVTLDPGQIAVIPRGVVHRAKAVGVDTTFIEVQTGTSFEESDIERFSDDYGRA